MKLGISGIGRVLVPNLTTVFLNFVPVTHLLSKFSPGTQNCFFLKQRPVRRFLGGYWFWFWHCFHKLCPKITFFLGKLRLETSTCFVLNETRCVGVCLNGGFEFNNWFKKFRPSLKNVFRKFRPESSNCKEIFKNVDCRYNFYVTVTGLEPRTT